MEDSTSIANLNGRDNKVSIDNVSYSDILGQMQQKPVPIEPAPVQTAPLQTPISQLNPSNMGLVRSRPDTMEPPPNHQMMYSEQGMYPMQQVQQHPNMAFNPPAYRHGMPSAMRQRESDEASETVTSKENGSGDFQNEMFVLLVIYVLIHTEQFQTLIRTKLPSMFNAETNHINIFGTLMNGVFLIVAWNIAKKVVVKYMKEFN